MADNKDRSGKTSGQTGSQSGNPRNQQLQRDQAKAGKIKVKNRQTPGSSGE
jgi:hypothetical protein